MSSDYCQSYVSDIMGYIAGSNTRGRHRQRSTPTSDPPSRHWRDKTTASNVQGRYRTGSETRADLCLLCDPVRIEKVSGEDIERVWIVRRSINGHRRDAEPYDGAGQVVSQAPYQDRPGSRRLPARVRSKRSADFCPPFWIFASSVPVFVKKSRNPASARSEWADGRMKRDYVAWRFGCSRRSHKCHLLKLVAWCWSSKCSKKLWQTSGLFLKILLHRNHV